MTKAHPKIIIAGAGSIGCFVGGMLQHAGGDVAYLGRTRMAKQIATQGLKLSDYSNWSDTLPPETVTYTDDPNILKNADIVLVCVKSSATAEIGRTIAKHAPKGAQMISLQNGVRNADILRSTLAGFDVFGGMVPFNVLQTPEGVFHRGTAGAIKIEAGVKDLNALQISPIMDVQATDSINNILWGKLSVNLNNALNALSGVPLVEELADHGWRKLLAAQMDEAFAAMDAAGIVPDAATPVPPKKLPKILRLPTPIYKMVALSKMKIDAKARSSMWEDLERGRKTEIDELQGAVVDLSAKYGLRAPVCAAVKAKIEDAEKAGNGSPGLTPRGIGI